MKWIWVCVFLVFWGCSKVTPEDLDKDSPFGECGSEGKHECSGVCVDLQSDVGHCGKCDKSCEGFENTSKAECVGGKCVIECEVGYGDCNQDVSDGCERILIGDSKNCGKCNHRCMKGAICKGLSCDKCAEGFVYIDSGGKEFMMGDLNYLYYPKDTSQALHVYPHKVKFSQGFCIQAREVSVCEHEKLMPEKVSLNKSARDRCKDLGFCCSMSGVSWYDAVEYANRLSVEEGLEPCYNASGDGYKSAKEGSGIYQCKGYRLATEAEWEYVARASALGEYSFGVYEENESFKRHLGEIAWYKENSGSRVNMSGLKKKHTGIYSDIFDMYGNVSEWCHDTAYSYHKQEVLNPAYDDDVNNQQKVHRGGGFNGEAKDLGNCKRSFAANPRVMVQQAGIRLVHSVIE